MTSKFKALVLDLGGVLLEWDHHSIHAISPEQFLAIANSTTWHSLDRGNITLKEAYQKFGNMLGEDPSSVATAMDQAQLSLKPVNTLIRTVLDLKASRPDLKLYVMSNISQEHFKIVKSLDFPWSIFDKVFVSGIEGMRKPDLCFFHHVIKEIGVRPSEMVMVDDTPENVCAARSQGMHAILVHKSLPSVSKTLLNLMQDPIQRAEAFLKEKAREHHCVIEGHEELRLKDNFAQLMIWELTDDEDIIYLKWPYGKTHGINPPRNVDHSNGNEFETSKVENGLWNYFFEAPVLTTREFPPDADTTVTAYLSLPEQYLSTVPDVRLVVERMCNNLDTDGIMQVYFDDERPRTVAEVCCNILRMFNKFGFGSDPRAKKSEDYVVDCLNNNACLDGTRHYSTPESFLYFVARLYAETSSDTLRRRLSGIKTQLMERLNVPANPLALALRLFACQTVDLYPELYRKDLQILLSLQEEDGGWPAGHFCRLGRTGTRIGNRGLTTALAVRILHQEEQTV
ncbi:HAD-like domain-containing protein [Diaporthe sp. PMI_573]|nr:HAD-like domain-containing protein [Diaporthaceae sp. PMI_573]